MPETGSEIPKGAKKIAESFQKRVTPLLDKKSDVVSPDEDPSVKATKLAAVKQHLANFNMGIPDIAEDGSVTPRNEPWSHAGPQLPYEGPSPRVLQELSRSEKIADPETGQQFGFVRANWGSFTPEQTVTVISSLYGNEATQKNKGGKTPDSEVSERIIRVADKMPLTPVISFDYPSYGDSDPLGKSQRSSRPEDSFFAVADAELRALKDLGVKKINVMGESMGAFASLTLALRAAEFEVQVDNVLLYETPGVEKMPVWKLMMRDMSEIANNLGIYSAFPYDKRMYESSRVGEERGLMENIRELLRLPRESLRKDPNFVYARSMAEDVVEKRAKEVFDSQDALKASLPGVTHFTKIAFINGSESTVSPVAKVKGIVDRLRRLGYEKRVSRSIYLGEGHLNLIHAGRWAADVELRLRKPLEVMPKDPAKAA